MADQPAPAGSALLLVDVQRDFLSSALGHLWDGYVDRVRRLLGVARGAGMPVVHVHSAFAPDGSDWMRRYRLRGSIPCVRGTPGAVVLPGCEPAPDEPVVEKQTFDGFLGTGLHDVLRSRGVESLLVAGLVTSTCVLLTAASAMQHGYLVAVVEDATADVPATHEAVLAQYPYVFDRTTVAASLSWAAGATSGAAAPAWRP